MLYRTLKFIIGIGMRLYYREIKVKNENFLEHDGPMIIIANHPNTLMDAWMIGHVCHQPIYFMAKGTFFNTPLKRKILNSLNMIPINRNVAEKVDGVSNEDSFEACYKVLGEGKTLVIFPEGNSLMERQLRQLKSGTARIALETESRNNGKLNLRVVPMGLFYSQAEKFRSSAMITIEQGLFVTDYLEEFKTHPSVAAKKLTQKFRTHLERVLVTAENTEQENLIDSINLILSKKENANNIEKSEAFLKHIKERIEEIQLVHPYRVAEIQQLVQAIKWQSEKLEIQSDFINRRFRSRLYLTQVFISILFLLIGFPIFLFGFIHNVIPFQLTAVFVPRLTKNVEYYAAIAVLLGLVLYPLNYIGFTIGFNHLFHPPLWLKTLYFISLPISGLYAYSFTTWFKKIGHKWKYIFLIFNKREALKTLQMERRKLEKLLWH